VQKIEVPISRSDLDLLSKWDTPTVCNALELLNPNLPLTAFTTSPGVTIADNPTPMVGVARVGTIRSRERASSVAVEGLTGTTMWVMQICRRSSFYKIWTSRPEQARFGARFIRKSIAPSVQEDALQMGRSAM
jgi:hypothetical protein